MGKFRRRRFVWYHGGGFKRTELEFTVIDASSSVEIVLLTWYQDVLQEVSAKTEKRSGACAVSDNYFQCCASPVLDILMGYHFHDGEHGRTVISCREGFLCFSVFVSPGQMADQVKTCVDIHFVERFCQSRADSLQFCYRTDKLSGIHAGLCSIKAYTGSDMIMFTSHDIIIPPPKRIMTSKSSALKSPCLMDILRPW